MTTTEIVTRSTTKEEALAQIRRVHTDCEALRQSLAGWVNVARYAGASWVEVGRALGITRQSASERFRSKH